METPGREEHTGLAPAAFGPATDTTTRAERTALRLLQLGALAMVLIAATWKSYELDRFFIPKELVLHATAVLAATFALRASRRTRFGVVDGLLVLVVLLGIASAATALNPWLGVRAVAIGASGVALFWTARAVSSAGLQRPLLAALALAVIAAAATALLQAYGLRTDFFSINRAPGGTLGNRNFIAHLAAFGAPVVLLVTVRARRPAGFLLWALGMLLVTASLVLTRSRAGWLAFGAVVVVFGIALFASPALRRDGRTWLRLAGVLVLAGAGVAAALTLPNSLRWRSDNPYLESMKDVANYQEGSGRGRLIQYRRSLQMALGEPLLGVGPGNWAVVYPEHAGAGDPSLDRSAAGMTSNPWPSSDWVAFVSERGLPATLLLALAMFGIALGAFRRLRRTTDPAEAMGAAALLATGAAALVAGMFDAVLLLAVPAFIVWTVLGALGAPGESDPQAHAGHGAQTLALALFALLALGGTVRSAGQLAAMGLHTTGNPTLLRYAALVDPGSYRVHLALARNGPRAQRCRHAEAAHALYPNAQAARSLKRGC